MTTIEMRATSVRLETLSPHHYQSLAIPSGAASLAPYMADRSVAYGLAAAMGCLFPGVGLPQKNYRRDFNAMTWFASAFEAQNPGLMPPQGRRLNLDGEGGYQKRIQDATGTGNLKTWFFIQEIQLNTVYDGAVFGPDPFDMASTVENRDVNEILFRVGRHRGGLVRMMRAPEAPVRLNLHTGYICGAPLEHDDRLRVDIPALWDLQISEPVELRVAEDIISEWKSVA